MFGRFFVFKIISLVLTFCYNYDSEAVSGKGPVSAFAAGEGGKMKRKIQVVTRFLIAVVSISYFLVHLVPGSPDIKDFLSISIGLVALFSAIRKGDELDELDQEAAPSNRRVDVSEIVLRQPPPAAVSEIDIPTFIRLGLAEKFQCRLDDAEKESFKQEVAVTQVVTVIAGGRSC